MQLRHAEEYGDINLSIQASKYHYCTPRVDGLPLEKYETVEIAFLYDGGLRHPSVAGIEGFDDIFEPGSNPVAGYVSWDKVNELREAIKNRAKGE